LSRSLRKGWVLGIIRAAWGTTAMSVIREESEV
jgi:hypothetical protein